MGQFNQSGIKFNQSNLDFNGTFIASGTTTTLERPRYTREPKRPSNTSLAPTPAPSHGWDDYTTTPTPTNARAFIGVDEKLGHTFRFNPDEVSWDYSENVFSQDTLGGRVVQLLSVSLNGMVVTGRSGNRREFQKLAKNIKDIMQYHVSTLQPVQFKVPSRNWNFKVYIKAMPTMSWDLSSTSYPYQLELLIDEDLTGIKAHDINKQVLQRLASGIGYDYSSSFRGGNAELFRQEYELVQAHRDMLTGGTPPGAVSPAAVSGTATEDCTGKGCTVAAFMTAVARYVGGNPSPQVLTVLINWAAEEGGSINNSYSYNLCNTGWEKGVKIVNNSGSFPAYASFKDGVAAHGKTLMQRGLGYEGIIKGIKSGDTTALAKAINDSKWCATNCYGSNGSDLLQSHGSYGKQVLP